MSPLEHPALAGAIQEGIPLTPRPFQALGQTTGLDEQTVISALSDWRERGLLREISAVLEGESFGWESALVAAAVDPAEIDRVAAVVGAHPNVTHNYERTHRFNLWFTLAVPPRHGLRRTLDMLEEESGAGPFLPLPRTATYKIAVRMDPKTRGNRSRHRRRKGPIPRIETTPEDRLLFRLLQTPLPMEPRPWRALAATADLDEERLLSFARRHLGGAMRRYAGTFHHRRLGVRGNVMTAWSVPESRCSEVGLALAELPEVSHCYSRQTHPELRFSLYAMIHGPDVETCGQIAAIAAERLEVPPPALLQSTREFKKCRLRYFLPELDAWWAARSPHDGGEG